MSKAKRVDKNQQQIVKQLRSLGFTVELTYRLGKGFPDFIIADGFFTIPVELKSKGGKLTPDEIQFHNRYKGYIIIAYDIADILLGVCNFYEKLKNNGCETIKEIQIKKNN